MVRVQHADDDLVRDTEPWQYVPELVRRDDETLVHKCYGDSFADTVLEAVLSEGGVRRVVVIGARTDMRIRARCLGPDASGPSAGVYRSWI